MIPSFTISSDLDLLLPITVLFPLTAILLVTQRNPYQTLVLRGILGSVATLLYALLGAPDVALTEALVGTLLSTTLYAIALRSAMALRVQDRRCSSTTTDPVAVEQQLADWISPLHLRLCLLPGSAEQPSDRESVHGWLEADRRLILHKPELLQQLKSCWGYRQWLKHGGELLLMEDSHA